MTKLWQCLSDELGSAFKNQYGLANGPVFKRWCDELSEFSEEQLFDGLQKFKRSGSTYMSLNIFRNHCMPKANDFGIGAFEQVHPLIIRREWEKLHPAFQHLARGYDMYNIARMTHENSAKALRGLYNEVISALARGEAFERLEAIESNPSGVTHISKEACKKGREDFKSVLNELRASK
jgi:hypothetical protein